MRFVLAGITLLVFAATVAYPLVAAIGALLFEPIGVVEPRGAAGLLGTTLGWATAITLAATILGWPAGRVLAAALHRRRFGPLAVALLLPVCLPAYLVFYAWWQTWPADSAAYRWAVEHDLVRGLRLATLGVSLTCWSWPIVAWSVAGTAAGDAARRGELLLLDGASLLRRIVHAARHDRRGLLLGAAIVFVLIFGNTTCFDLAEVFTFGNELRAMSQQGASSADLVLAASPALGLALLAAAGLWLALARAGPPLRPRPATPGPGLRGTVIAIWVVSIALPMATLLSRIADRAQVVQFVRLYGEGLAGTLALAAIAGAVAAIVAIGLGAQWSRGRGAAGLLAHAQAGGWILAAVVPATITVVGLEAAYNIPVIVLQTGQNVREALAAASPQSESTVADLMYRSPVILLLGHLSRFGAVGALFGWWLARQEHARARDLRRIDGGERLGAWLATVRVPAIAAVTATFAITTVLSLGEVFVTTQLQPPGVPLIASSLLNDMHYQRPQTVLVAAAAFVALALAATLVVAAGWRWTRAALPIAALVLVLGGCTRSTPDAVTPIDADRTFGVPGLAPGQFNYPRGIAVDGVRKRLFVVDKTARVQRFSLDGEPQSQWRMPEHELGKPTGLNVAPDGTVYVADTHYFRIIRYDADGHELMRFGAYGEDPGEFIYPTDVAFGPDDLLYVSEYGGHDRIQVFTTDGRYLFEFGSFGNGPDQYSRPQSMVFSPDRSELFIADSCNHRIVVVDPSGRTLRTIGVPGRGPGELMYPYDLTLLEDGSLLVCEFGNNRVQRFDASGRCIALLGGEGPGPGELRYPWGVDASGDRVFVLDSGNNRVQIVDL